MIIFRYLARHIFQGSALVLLILVSLSLFFSLVRELDDIGRGQYGMPQVLYYLLLSLPSYVVDYMPLAALLGCILSLGNLASHSEIIAMQSSGLSLKKLLAGVSLAVALLAILSLSIADLVVPYSESMAREVRLLKSANSFSIQSRKGIWVKDENNIIFIEHLYPDGNAQNVEIYHLDLQGRLKKTTHAATAKILDSGWQLQDIKISVLDTDKVAVQRTGQAVYQGSLSRPLLVSLAVDPQQMALSDLNTYINFLRRNDLDHQSESLSFWRKIYAPLGIVAMGVLAIPFVLGSQRRSNTGQRIMTGILLGLLYVVLNRLFIQLGEHMQLVAYINALLPTLFFLLLTLWLIRRKTVV